MINIYGCWIAKSDSDKHQFALLPLPNTRKNLLGEQLHGLDRTRDLKSWPMHAHHDVVHTDPLVEGEDLFRHVVGRTDEEAVLEQLLEGLAELVLRIRTRPAQSPGMIGRVFVMIGSLASR